MPNASTIRAARWGTAERQRSQVVPGGSAVSKSEGVFMFRRYRESTRKPAGATPAYEALGRPVGQPANEHAVEIVPRRLVPPRPRSAASLAGRSPLSYRTRVTIGEQSIVAVVRVACGPSAVEAQLKQRGRHPWPTKPGRRPLVPSSGKDPSQVNPSQPQQSTSAVLLAIVALSLSSIIVQLQAATQGSVRDLLPLVVAGLLAMAGVTSPGRPEL
jgi:hypothetical protein